MLNANVVVAIICKKTMDDIKVCKSDDDIIALR